MCDLNAKEQAGRQVATGSSSVCDAYRGGAAPADCGFGGLGLGMQHAPVGRAANPVPRIGQRND